MKYLYTNYLIKLFVTLSVTSLHSQNYSYQKFQSDNKLRGKLFYYAHNNKMDSLKSNLENYGDKLGYSYFQLKSIIANFESDTNQIRYLDSAFMRGFAPLCLGNDLQKFDSAKVSESFKKNFLKSYNESLINLFDSMFLQDQRYRREIMFEKYKKDEAKSEKKGNSPDRYQQSKIHQPSKSRIIDSLWKLQAVVDSLNFLKLNEIIDKYGWPSAKIIGDSYCRYSKKDKPNVAIFVEHLGKKKRAFQISTLKTVIELCKKNEESWNTANLLIFNLHSRFREEFSEFSFIQIENNHIQLEESYFSIYNMATLLIQSPSDKIVIKCKSHSIYLELKQAMLSINDKRSFTDRELKDLKEINRPHPKYLDENSFQFIESPEIREDVILYKFIKQ